MSMQFAITIRAKKLGVLMRDARLSQGKSLEDCAKALGILPATIEAYEFGDQSPSLPEMELFAYHLGISMEHFWGQVTMSEGGNGRQKFDPRQLISLRQRIIGVQIRKARIESQLSIEEMSGATAIPAARLESYELGEAPIPVPELEMLINTLRLSIRDFQDRTGPVGSWFHQQRAMKDFSELSPELQLFVSKPVNRPYLEIAQRLSEMPVDRLRTVAEVLLEITL